MNVSAILRALIFTALFGAAVLVATGIISNLGRKAGGSLKAAA